MVSVSCPPSRVGQLSLTKQCAFATLHHHFFGPGRSTAPAFPIARRSHWWLLSPWNAPACACLCLLVPACTLVSGGCVVWDFWAVYPGLADWPAATKPRSFLYGLGNELCCRTCDQISKAVHVVVSYLLHYHSWRISGVHGLVLTKFSLTSQLSVSGIQIGFTEEEPKSRSGLTKRNQNLGLRVRACGRRTELKTSQCRPTQLNPQCRCQ